MNTAATFIVPNASETQATGVIAATEGKCPITGDKIRLQFSLERRWEFFVDGRRAAPFGEPRKNFHDESRAAIRSYLKSPEFLALQAA